MGNAVRALSDADKIISMRPDWMKGYQRKGEALILLGKYEEAATNFAKALQLEPNNPQLQTKLNSAIQQDIQLRHQQSSQQSQTPQNSSEPKEKKWWQFF